MTIDEFSRISADHNWGGYPGSEFWNEIQLVYMNTSLNKTQIAWLYWMHTGLFESLVQVVRAAKDNVTQVACGRMSLLDLKDVDDLRAAERDALALCGAHKID